MLCGYPPFYAESENEIKREVMRRKYQFDDDWQYISDEAKDLIRRMLSAENVRPTAPELLEHPWFYMEYNESQSNLDFSSRCLSRMNKFSDQSTFIKLIYTVIVYRCNVNEEIDKYVQIFKQIDENKNGFITSK